LTYNSARTQRLLGLYALALGAAYAAAALAGFAGGEPMSPANIPDMAVCLLISATYLNGAKELFAAKDEGLSFVLAGLLISAAVGGLYLLMTGADLMMHALGEGSGDLMGIRIETVLLILALPLTLAIWRATKQVVW